MATFFTNMACPFDNDPVDEGAALLRRELNIRREMVIRPRIDVLAFPHNYLFEFHVTVHHTHTQPNPSLHLQHYQS